MKSRLLSIFVDFSGPQLSILFSTCNPHQVLAPFLEVAEQEKRVGQLSVFC